MRRRKERWLVVRPPKELIILQDLWKRGLNPEKALKIFYQLLDKYSIEELSKIAEAGGINNLVDKELLDKIKTLEGEIRALKESTLERLIEKIRRKSFREKMRFLDYFLQQIGVPLKEREIYLRNREINKYGEDMYERLLNILKFEEIKDNNKFIREIKEPIEIKKINIPGRLTPLSPDFIKKIGLPEDDNLEDVITYLEEHLFGKSLAEGASTFYILQNNRDGKLHGMLSIPVRKMEIENDELLGLPEEKLPLTYLSLTIPLYRFFSLQNVISFKGELKGYALFEVDESGGKVFNSMYKPKKV